MTRKIRTTLSRLKRKHRIEHHPLTMRDFNRICKAEAIKVVCFPLQLRGFYANIAGVDWIALDSKLGPDKLLFVAFHELGHYLMHEPDRAATLYQGSGRSPKEIEADMFAEEATNAY